MPSRRSFWASAGLAAMAAAWIALVVVPPVALLRVRAGWLQRLEQPEAQAQWDAFRADMQRQSGRDGPVQRKVPRSVEPPLRVWLRDYVWMGIAAWVLFGGIIGFATLLFMRGVMRGVTRGGP